jgi:hypothetical protein
LFCFWFYRLFSQITDCRYISDAKAGRALFLHVGRDTIRAPRLIQARKRGAHDDDDENSKKQDKDGAANNNGDDDEDDDIHAIDMDGLPPADVPEWQLFALLQVC